jgi:hypothetical protein
MVLAPEVAWIMLCDHDKVLRHLFWANLAVYRVGPLAQVVGAPSWSPTTLGRTSLSINSVAVAGLEAGFCVEFSVVEQSLLSVCETPT